MKDEVYIGQELFLVQGTEMKIVEVSKISDSESIIHLRVKDLCDQEIIDISCSYVFDQEYSISWMIISVPYVVELVIERMKQQLR